MLWSEIIQRIETRVSESLGANTFFTEDAARRIVADKQVEMSERIKCLESFTRLEIGIRIEGDASSQITDLELEIMPHLLIDGKLHWSLVKAGSNHTFTLRGKYGTVATATSTSATVTELALTASGGSGAAGNVSFAWTINDSDELNVIRCGLAVAAPRDFIAPLEVRHVETNKILNYLERTPRLNVVPTGAPLAMFLLGDNNLGFMPYPTTTEQYVDMHYVRKAAEYLFKIERIDADTDYVFTMTNDGDTFTVIKTYADGITPTEDETIIITNLTAEGLVAAINAHATIKTWVKAYENPGVSPEFPAARMETMAEGVTITTDIEPVYADLEIPAYMHKALIEGVVDEFRQKDREYNKAGLNKSYYEREVQRFAAMFEERRNSMGYYPVNDIYSGIPTGGQIEMRGFVTG